MSHSRSPMVEIFEKELKPEEKTEIRKKIIKMLENNSHCLSRIFDDCPCLLSSSEVNTLTEEFKQILSQIQPKVGVSNLNEISLPRREDQVIVDEWINKIACLGIGQLLTLKGEMRPDFIEYFQLKKFESSLKIRKSTISILCGFVSRINQEVMYRSSEEIDKNQHAYSAFCNYLNNPKNNRENLKNQNHEKEIPNNIKRIAKEAMDSKKLIFNHPVPDREKLSFEQIARWPIEKPSHGTLMVLAAITPTSSVFFKKMDKEVKVKEAKDHLPESLKNR